jgi:hypothetical protein
MVLACFDPQWPSSCPNPKMFRRAKYELDGLPNVRSALLIHHRAAFWLISVTESPEAPAQHWKEQI